MAEWMDSIINAGKGTGQGDAKRYPIYIVLTDTGTLFSKLIRMYTKAPLNHVSVAFDPALREVYSFGQKPSRNPLTAGFMREEVERDLLRADGKPTICAMYRCMVNAAQYHMIRARIITMMFNEAKYSYNLLGVLGIPFKLQVEREKAFFCSQFVASLFEECGLNVVGKPAAAVEPDDFRSSEMLELVYKGDLRNLVQPVYQEELEWGGMSVAL